MAPLSVGSRSFLNPISFALDGATAATISEDFTHAPEIMLGRLPKLAAVTRANAALHPGQVMIVSIVATPHTGTSFLQDFVTTALLAKDAGAHIVEANFSCPNVDKKEGLLYTSPDTVKEIASAFRTVRKNTIQIAEDIPEAKYSYQPAADTRTVAQTLAHIAQVPRFQLQLGKLNSMEGFDFQKFFAEAAAEEKKPRTKAELVQLLRDSGEEFAKWAETLPEDTFGSSMRWLAGHLTIFSNAGNAST